MPSFQFVNKFVDSAAIDRNSRQLIRSHVMKGRNAGKTIRRVPRKTRQTTNSLEPAKDRTTSSEVVINVTESQECEQSSKIELGNRMWNGFLTFSYPLEVTPHVASLLHDFFAMIGKALHPPEFCVSQDLMKCVWFEYILLDEAFFHCTLAISATMVNFLLSRDEEDPKALVHLSQAFHLVNTRLSTSEALSDTNIAVVVCLGIRDMLQGDLERRRLHLGGLKRMVEMRGGLGQLQRNYALLQKICRCDIDYALHTGVPPYFYWDNFPRETLYTAMSAVRIQRAYGSAALRSLPPDLLQATLDIMDLAHLLNTYPDAPRLEPFAFQDALTSLCYRLLVLRPVVEPGEVAIDPTARLAHLGLMAFMSTLALHFGRSTGVPFQLLARNLYDAHQRASASSKCEPEIRLWLILVSSVSVFDETQKLWAAEEARKLAGSLGLRSWEDLRQTLHTFAWIDCLHGRQGKAFWESTIGASRLGAWTGSRQHDSGIFMPSSIC